MMVNTEETLKHFGTFWEIYQFIGCDGRTYDEIKRYLMKECDRPESTARAKINAFQAADDNLYSYHRSDKKVYFDYDKFNDLEDEIDHWLDIETNDYRGEQLAQLKKQFEEIKQEAASWECNYFNNKKLRESQQRNVHKRLIDTKQKALNDISCISEQISTLTDNMDVRLQLLENRSSLERGLSFVDRVKLFIQTKFGLIPMKEFSHMEAQLIQLSGQVTKIKTRYEEELEADGISKEGANG